MPPLADLQAALARAVVGGSAELVGADLVGGHDPRGRLAIHARHYERSLTAALAAKFPATAWLIGAAAMRDAARAYARARPPRTPCIAEYGGEFPAFLANGGALRALRYLGSFAELEWAVGEVSIAVDLPVRGWAAAAAVGPQRLLDCRLTMQPGLRFLRCGWPVDALMKLYLGGSAPEQFMLKPEDVRIQVRGARGTFQLRRLEPAAFTFRRSLQAGRSVGEAAERALDRDSGFDAGAELRRVLEAGLAGELGQGGER